MNQPDHTYREYFLATETISDAQKIYYLAKALNDIADVARVSEGVEWYEMVAREALRNAHE